jgi:hypothetical protein
MFLIRTLTRSQAFRRRLCSEPTKLDHFWLAFSAVIPRLGGAESNESVEARGPPSLQSDVGSWPFATFRCAIWSLSGTADFGPANAL